MTQFLVDRILLRPVDNGFNTEISETSLDNLYVLAALVHGIFSEVMYDTFKPILMHRGVLERGEGNRREILEEYIYARYKYFRTLPPMD